MTRRLVRADSLAGGGHFFTRYDGEYHAQRVPTYHRMDVRISRQFDTTRGRAVVFADVWNVYNRHNARTVFLNVTGAQRPACHSRGAGLPDPASAQYRYQLGVLKNTRRPANFHQVREKRAMVTLPMPRRNALAAVFAAVGSSADDVATGPSATVDVQQATIQRILCTENDRASANPPTERFGILVGSAFGGCSTGTREESSCYVSPMAAFHAMNTRVIAQ